MLKRVLFTLCLVAVSAAGFAEDNDVTADVEHHYVDNNGVNIHYATMGEGPLVVLIHGFPDFWYTWHHQMAGLSDNFTVAALDCRGYNLSDKPEGQENYDMTLLVSDVAAVIRDQGQENSIIIGHDWGGVIAWQFTMSEPEMVEKLIIVNLPHPKPLSRELANSEQQQANSIYARRFQEPDSHTRLNAEMLSTMVSRGDAGLKEKYKAAFEQSSFDGMMNYYRQNYPREPYEEIPDGVLPKIHVPVLQFHGMNDTALLYPALNDSWEQMEKDYTLVTIPGAGHFAQQEAHEIVTSTMKWWLLSRQ